MIPCDPGKPLTPRERQVLDLVLAFKCNKEIASAFNIDVRTVKEHVSQIYRKFAVHDRAGLLALHYPNPPVRYAA